jgi:hypothetical protein
MKIIDLQKTDKTPEIILDDEKKFFQIKGNCLPENIRDFSALVTEKFDEYLKQWSSGTTISDKPDVFRVIFRLGYFNSAAAKFLADVLIMTNNYIQQGYTIKIYWYFDVEDHDMLEAGEEISQMVSVPMEFVAMVKGD